MDDRVYLDHASTTFTRPEVLEEMLPYFTKIYGNPSSVHSFGREAKKSLDLARERTARALNADFGEIYFTAGGSESDNWALRGAALANQKKGNHIITTCVEHHAVLRTCEDLQRSGFDVTYLPVDREGLVIPEQVRDAITDRTILISVMTANNEIGTIQPIREIGAIARERGILFHTDAVQAIGSVPIDVKDMKVDMLSLSAHKFYGPKGVGALYIRKGVKVRQLISGGPQERDHRAGTENLPGIVGLGKAMEIATLDIPGHNARLSAMRDRMIQQILTTVDHTRLNGHPAKRLPGNVNIGFEFTEGESLLLRLDQKGIAASSGSACSSGSLNPSHVLLAIGLPEEIARGSLRLTLGDENTKEEIDYVLDVLPRIVQSLRETSPLFLQERKGVKHI